MTHVFVAPHPDDVALSCGGLIASLRELGQAVTIITVYSGGAAPGATLSDYQREVLGFGNKTNYISGFERKPKHKAFQTVYQRAFHTKVLADEFSSRISARLNLLLRAK